MGLRNLLSIKAVFLICLVIFSGGLRSQKIITCSDSVFVKLLDADLNERKSEKLFSKPTVIISNTNCIACAQYFTKAKKKFNFVFILSNESFGEINRILEYHGLKKSEALFTTCKYIKHLKQDLCNSPTPCLIYAYKKHINFYNYSDLNTITNEFSLKMTFLFEKLKTN